MTPNDLSKLKDIAAAMQSGEPTGTALALIREYYADADRADRTGRDSLYLHYGFLIGVAEETERLARALVTYEAAARTIAEAKTDSAEWHAARELLFPVKGR